MVRALVGCGNCGFVTRRYSYLGAGGQCPDCFHEMRPVTIVEARRLAHRKHTEGREASQGGRAEGMAVREP